MYWQQPSQLLDLFGEMAERNLFLVQHLQVCRFAKTVSVMMCIGQCPCEAVTTAYQPTGSHPIHSVTSITSRSSYRMM